MTKKLFLLAASSYAMTAFATGAAPKWSTRTSLPELIAICKAETGEKEKLQVCTQAISKANASADLRITPDLRAIAAEMIQLAATHPGDSAYIFGLHDSHSLLGRAALEDGDVANAKSELEKSLEVPRTPHLQTLGPSWTLAKDLLQKGEKAAVLKYLDQAERYWKYGTAPHTIEKWRKQIQKGKTPDFKI